MLNKRRCCFNRVALLSLPMFFLSACVVSNVDVPVVDRYAELNRAKGTLLKQKPVEPAVGEQTFPDRPNGGGYGGASTAQKSMHHKRPSSGVQSEIVHANTLEQLNTREVSTVHVVTRPAAIDVKNASRTGGELAPSPHSVKKQSDEIVYTVVQGDTLFSIAWRSDTDYRMLAERNNLEPPFIIHPGQRLSLLSNVNDRKVASGGVLIGHKLDKENSLLENGYKKRGVDKKTIQERSGKNELNKVNLYWVWPANGKVISQFQSSGVHQKAGVNKGLNIAGHAGQPVYAAANGKVVYSGQGLRGYGKLIIVKHNDQLLSAYGHNRDVLVTEGDFVKAGEQIAEIGSTGTVSNQLHFEIRERGNPVDPLLYLPDRAAR